MKTNIHGEPQPGPGDDLTAAFQERYDNSERLEAFRSEMEHAEHMGGWCVEVRNEDGDGLTVRDFETEGALEAYLKKHGVRLV